MSLKDLIEWAAANWESLAAAPLAFGVLVLVAFSAAFFVSRWAFQTRLDSKQERIDNLQERIDHFQERLDTKDELLDRYRQQLGSDTPHGGKYSRMSDAELKHETLQACQGVRRLLSVYRMEENTALHHDMRLSASSTSEQDRRASWSSMTQGAMSRSTALMESFNQQFKGQFLALRDELLSRGATTPQRQAGHATILYEHPTNPLGLEDVVTDLERLAHAIA